MLRDPIRRRQYDLQQELSQTPTTELRCDIPFSVKQGLKGHTFMLQAQRRVVCLNCNGLGEFESQIACDKCCGIRYVIEDVYKRIHLEAGARSGHQVVYKNCGHQQGSTFGDLIIVFTLQLDPEVELVQEHLLITK